VLAGKHVAILDGEVDFVNMRRHVLGVAGMSTMLDPHAEYAEGSFADVDLVIVGPGPGDPRDGDDPKIATFRGAVDRLLETRHPFLAVCLGHQVLCDRLGIPLTYKDIVFQGTQDEIVVDGRQERVGFYNTFVGRVVVSTSSTDEARPTDEMSALPDGVVVDADPTTGDVHHVHGPHFRGIQFHAESILTQHGADLIHRLVADLLG
jgi:phenazine biosynthesis protein phzE